MSDLQLKEWDLQRGHILSGASLVAIGEKIEALQSQLIQLHRALGVFNADHDKALLKAEHAIADSELLEWAEGQEYEIEDHAGIVQMQIWEGSDAQCFHGPDLRDVLRQAREWETKQEEK